MLRINVIIKTKLPYSSLISYLAKLPGRAV
jgi:hypothetical protein